jgi:hypothetical protein
MEHSKAIVPVALLDRLYGKKHLNPRNDAPETAPGNQ